MSSEFAQRWVKRVLAVLAVGQLSMLTLGSSPVSILGTATADHQSEETGGEGGATITTEPASSTSTTAEGESPPDVTANIVGTLGNGGWYVDNVALTWTTEDLETPISSTDGCDASSVETDTTGVSFSCTAVSEGGSRTTTATIARDATAPGNLSVTTNVDPAPSGWFVQPFIATWHGDDPTSGVESCFVAPEYTGPDTATGSIDGTCTDNAGNQSAAHAFAFKFDATLPSVVGTPDRAANDNGWYNADVTVTWSSTDPDAVCDAPTTYTTGDSATASVSGTCTDPAGNVGSGTFDFKFDETAPTITLTTPGDGAIYILNQPVNADYACEDLTSGVDTCIGTTADGAALDTDNVGSHTYAVNATDLAGNAAVPAEATYLVQYQPAGVNCGGVAGHTILDPIAKRTTTFKQGSSVPAKFRVCDWNGTPVTSAGVVQSFRMIGEGGASVDKAVGSRNSHLDFRAGDAQWIYNIDTKPMSATAYLFRIGLDDGTAIDFGFVLR